MCVSLCVFVCVCVCVCSVALAYSAQVVSSVPVDAHDQNIDILATASGLHGCTERGKAVLSDS